MYTDILIYILYFVLPAQQSFISYILNNYLTCIQE